MKPFQFLLFFVVFLWIGCTPASDFSEPTTEDQPNIIFILIDDIGIISTPPYSSNTDSTTVWSLQADSLIDPTSLERYTTPNISNFSAQAKRLNYMYATPSCAPSRAQLLTGKYPYRTGVIFPAFASDSAASAQYPGCGYLADTELTYANKLQKLGYHTGFGGKYNLRYGIGDSDAQAEGEDMYNEMVHNQMVHLKKLGFSETFGPASIESIDGTDTIYNGGLALIGNTVSYYPQYADNGFFPDMLLNWGKAYIKERQKADQPYYLHYCLGLIHDSDPEPYPNQTPAAEFALKAQLADSIIGEILSLIEDDPNTVVIIAGDNGTETYNSTFGPGYASAYHQDTIPGGKLTFQSRGSRVPFLIRWPEVIDGGSYDGLVDFTDVFGTIYEIAGGTEALSNLDGQSFLYQITNGTAGKENTPRAAVFSQMEVGGFVANKAYLYYVDDVYTATSGSWFDISSSPRPDKAITAESVKPEDRELLERYFSSLETNGLAVDPCIFMH